MTQKSNRRWTVLVGANVLFYCMLSFYQASDAQSPPSQPFANAVEQRIEMIGQLREINAELKAQNALLRSGTLKVVIDDKKPR